MEIDMHPYDIPNDLQDKGDGGDMKVVLKINDQKMYMKPKIVRNISEFF